MANASEIFTRVYEEQRWGADGRGSGRGSTVENGRSTSMALSTIFQKYDLHSLLDAPCGALEWTDGFIAGMLERDPGWRYLGVDVVEAVIEQNRLSRTDARCRFEVMDLSKERLPSGYDLILCRDALQHLCYEDIAGVLQGFGAARASYLLVSSFNGKDVNKEIETGKFFRCDLLSEPFGFSDGLVEVFDDHRPSGVLKGQKLNLYDAGAFFGSAPVRAFVERWGRSS